MQKSQHAQRKKLQQGAREGVQRRRASVMLPVASQGHACVAHLSYSACFSSFQTFAGSAQMLGENKRFL